MLITEQKIKLNWNYANRKWFVNKGYTFTNWGDEFEVSPLDLHIGTPIKVNVICDYCGEQYKTEYRLYNQGRDKLEKDCCFNCAYKKAKEIHGEKTINDSYNKLLKKAKEKGYKLITPKEEYTNQTTRIEYECPKHGIQNMLASNFMKKYGCPKCAGVLKGDAHRLSIEEVIKRIESIEGNILLNPEDYIKNSTRNLLVKCSCGNTFYTCISDYHKKYRCSKCTKSESNGENKIRNYLQANNIKYIPQYKFKDCKDKNCLPFDSYLIDKNMCIEFDGEQHYRPRHGWSNFDYVQKHDKIKNDYCKYNNIKLIRIKYDQQDKINEILDNEFKIM